MQRSLTNPWKTLAQEVLKVMPHGLLLLDAGGRVLAESFYGRRILKGGDPLTRDGSGRIRGIDPATTSEIEQLLGQLSSTTTVKSLAASLPKRYGPEEVEVVLRRIREAESGAEAFLMILSDPDYRPEVAPELLEQLHRLTPTEARVASAFATGMRSTEVAQHLEIGTNTVRTHLKSVFAKTGARTQSDLIRMILAGPLWLSTDESD